MAISKKNKENSMAIERSYELVIIGGGLAGMFGAIAAARLGTKVALINDRPVLGGAGSSESRVGIGGVESERGMPNVPFFFHHARETGLMEEFTLENKVRNPSKCWSLFDMVFWSMVTAEPNLTLYLNTSAMRAEMKDDETIEAIRCWQTTTFKEFLIRGKIFIDASGDGHIAYDAGALYRLGRESKTEFGESLAPDKADTYTMAPSIYLEWRDAGHPVPFMPPKWAKPLSDADLLPMKTSLPNAYPENRFHDAIRLRIRKYGFWWMEFGGLKDTISDAEEIRDELYRIAYGMWDKIKNWSSGAADTLDLTWVGPVPGKRESRRFIGDHMLTQGDIWGKTAFPDSVAYGGRAIDLHTPGNIYARFTPAEYVSSKGLYSIPYRCLYSKNIKNLMMAGRNISVSHVALGSMRVMRQTAIIGEASGTAAALCIKYGVTPRGLYEQYTTELQQQLLKQDCFILDRKNEDPNDFARTAKVTASSTLPQEIVPLDEREMNVFELDISRGHIFRVTESHLESVTLFLESRRPEDFEIKLGLRASTSIYDFSATEDIATATAVVPGTGEPQPVNQQPPIASIKQSWVTFKFDIDVEPGYYWVWLPEHMDIYWIGVNDREPIGTRRVVWDEALGVYRPLKDYGSYCFKLNPQSKPYTGENVVSGVAHPTDEGANIWISERKLPQYIDLDFGQPKEIDTVYLTFDSNLNKEYGPRFLWLSGPRPEIVRDYIVNAEVDGRWVKVVEEQGNFQRHKIHTFNNPVTTQKIRLEVLATNGVSEARIYEIRAYREQN